MKAADFNRLYPVGTRFTRHGVGPYKTVGPARDFNCGTIVEINLAPYFVFIDTLTAI